MTTAAPLLTEDQLTELERAATSLLTDNEILMTLEITQEALERHYNVVEKARIKLKQKLNARAITEAAKTGEVKEIIENIPRNKDQLSKYRPSRGGARAGAGRKPGSGNKLTGAAILQAIEVKAGETFEDLLAEGYLTSIQNNDKATRLQYEKLFLSKVVADRADVDITSAGKAIGVQFTFGARELDDWNKASSD